MSPHHARRLGAMLCVELLAACGPSLPDLLPVPIPDSSAFERSVQDALTKARAEFDAAAARRPARAELAEAYGQLGMTYQALSLLAPAEVAYRDARRLAPADRRWPYLLGQVLKDSARSEEALKAFDEALALDPADKPTLHALARTALLRGELDKAQRAFEALQGSADTRAAGLAGLGKVAIARRDPKAAVPYLEAALRLQPSASRLRQPLALAYQALGERARAEEALRGYLPGGDEPEVPDPLREALRERAATSQALVQRGQRYGREGRFDLAAAAFEAAARSDPKDAATLANLGISLANLGELERAADALARSLSIEPANVQAELSLAIVLDRQGRDADAAAHYEAALRRDPRNDQARLYLADAELRQGHAAEAVRLYGETLAQRPSPRVRLSLAFAQVKAARYADAKAQLERGLADDPTQMGMSHALLRLLAAAPDDRVRDGGRGVQIGQALYEATHSPDVGQGYAMALAETGAFERAVAVQQEALKAYRDQPQQHAFVQKNLLAYQQRRPVREPWPADDPVFQPRSPAASR